VHLAARESKSLSPLLDSIVVLVSLFFSRLFLSIDAIRPVDIRAYTDQEEEKEEEEWRHTVILSLSLLGKQRAQARTEEGKRWGHKRESAQDHRNHAVPLIKVGSAREFLQATWFKKPDSYKRVIAEFF